MFCWDSSKTAKEIYAKARTMWKKDFDIFLGYYSIISKNKLEVRVTTLQSKDLASIPT